MLTIACPVCQSNMEIDEAERNTEWECPSCGGAFLVQRDDAGQLKLVIIQEATTHFASKEKLPIAADPGIPDKVYVEALESLLAGTRPREVRKSLVQAGYSPQQADRILQTAQHYQRENEALERAKLDIHGNSGRQNMIIGGTICVIGLIVTVGSCLVASKTGGTFLVASGAVFWGGAQFFRGFIQSRPG